MVFPSPLQVFFTCKYKPVIFPPGKPPPQPYEWSQTLVTVSRRNLA
ncbi:MAG: hypothetical protein K1X92_17995 [Bacteroidia bacterium]|nr:hypothetical protein [Bacteroidia bacterium]